MKKVYVFGNEYVKEDSFAHKIAEKLEGVEIVFEARKNFLKDHLGTYVEALSQRPGIMGHFFYSSVFQWLNELLKKECQDLLIEPDKVSWGADSMDSESFKLIKDLS